MTTTRLYCVPAPDVVAKLSAQLLVQRALYSLYSNRKRKHYVVHDMCTCAHTLHIEAHAMPFTHRLPTLRPVEVINLHQLSSSDHS